MTANTLRKRAVALGYRVSKGYSRYLNGGAIYKNYMGETFTGYNVEDLRFNCLVWPCYNEIRDRLFSLEDVANFLRDADTDHCFDW